MDPSAYPLIRAFIKAFFIRLSPLARFPVKKYKATFFIS
jgi:hypothetical protein